MGFKVPGLGLGGLDLSSLPKDEDTETADRRQRLIDNEGICSEIQPQLFVGGYKVAMDREILRSKGITHIVNTASNECEDYNVADKSLTYISYALNGETCNSHPSSN